MISLRGQSCTGSDLPDQLTADIIDVKGNTQTLTGNVTLRHRGTVLFCDQAIHDLSLHSVTVYGHILFVQGDSITARGDSAMYAYSDQHMLLYGRVMFQAHRTFLTTNQLDYNQITGVVTYTQKGRIVSDKNVLTSPRGTYNVPLNCFNCPQSAQLATRKGTAQSPDATTHPVLQADAKPMPAAPRPVDGPTLTETSRSLPPVAGAKLPSSVYVSPIPWVQQPAQPVSAATSSASKNAGLSDLERELNKKKRFR